MAILGLMGYGWLLAVSLCVNCLVWATDCSRNYQTWRLRGIRETPC